MIFPQRSSTLIIISALLIVATVRAAQTGPPQRVLGADDSTKRLAIIAPDGSVEWETKVGAIHDASLLPNGNILFQQGWTKLIEVFDVVIPNPRPIKPCYWIN